MYFTAVPQLHAKEGTSGEARGFVEENVPAINGKLRYAGELRRRNVPAISGKLRCAGEETNTTRNDTHYSVPLCTATLHTPTSNTI